MISSELNQTPQKKTSTIRMSFRRPHTTGRNKIGKNQEIFLSAREEKDTCSFRIMKSISCCLSYGAMSVLLSHCGDMVVPVTSSSENIQTANSGAVGSASGIWSGVVNYAVINGTSFETPMRVSISPSQDRVTTVAGDSGADTVAARRSGNTISWSILGSAMVTDLTLQQVSGGKARVTSRVTKDGKVMATGGGVFVRGG